MKDMTPLEEIRHSAAHVLATAVLRLFPGAKLDIGPPTESGFYYDFDVDKPLRVRINGKAPTAHIIDPDIGAMLDDYTEHGDPGLLYVDRISFP